MMIEKEKLIKKLENGIALEEKATLLIARLIRNKLQKRANISDKGNQRIIEILNTLEEDSKWHIRTVEGILEGVRVDERDYL